MYNFIREPPPVATQFFHILFAGSSPFISTFQISAFYFTSANTRVPVPANVRAPITRPSGVRSAPASESLSACSFPAPDASTHVSRAATIAPKLSDNRIGGGFGDSRITRYGVPHRHTAALAPGNSDATCPSSPIPSKIKSSTGRPPASTGATRKISADASCAAASGSNSPFSR